jgi:hypothetical protein
LNARRTSWFETIRNVPPFIASIIGIISALIAAGAWITTYFAAKWELELVRRSLDVSRCYSNLNADSLAAQVEQMVYIQQYKDVNARIAELKEIIDSGAASKEVQSEHSRLNKEADSIWDTIQDRKKRGEDLARDLRSQKCDTQ